MNNLAKTFSKYGGILAVCFEWMALSIYYFQYPLLWGGKYPISYFATLPRTRFVFGLCYVTAIQRLDYAIIPSETLRSTWIQSRNATRV